MADIQTYDDRDPSVVYSGGDWQKGGTENEYFQTTSYVRNATGSTATFKFTGTSVSVFGTLDSADLGRGTPISSYRIDNGQPVIYTGPTPDSEQYKQQFFQSPTLPPGPHTLVIVVQSEAGYYLDYFTVTPDPVVVVSSSAPLASSSSESSSPVPNTNHNPSTSAFSTSTTSTTTSSWSSFTTTSSSHPSDFTNTFTSSATLSGASTSSGPGATSTPEQSSRSTVESSKVGIAVGGAIGGLALLLVAFITALCMRRQLRAKHSTRLPDNNQNQAEMNSHNPYSQVSVSPFVNSPPPQTVSSSELGMDSARKPTPGIIPPSKAMMARPTAGTAVRHVASDSMGSVSVLNQSPNDNEELARTSNSDRQSRPYSLPPMYEQL
ncbi:hypothetical protein JR316_0012091 [Psilocybe cubensis]|uniref:Uncharacterized protein n=2 Tax=Psilocybe cubensis TaxID=181762 RepID=A0A8H8CFZ5_PSICU|nr:hypothetical protein JR316_0012091 [Psilocybe cubensis]KAH9474992.1 hypothetical protein JR316_0012091 [Psilocybe cubensis]